MEIKLFGVEGCPVCRELEQTVFDVLAELGVAAAVNKITDPDERLRREVYGLPGLMIEGKLKVSGRAPSRREIMTWVKEAAARS